MMKVKVKYFSLHREMAGKTEEKIHLEKGSTTQTLFEILLSTYPRFKEAKDYTIISLNGKFVDEPIKLKDEDIIAFFPPVGGG